MKKFKWYIALLAFILTMAVSVGGIYLRQRQMVNEPLLKRIGDYESVEAVNLLQKGDLLTVSVQLGYVQDLATIHRELSEEISRLLGRKNYRLELVDKRDESLDEAYVAVHLALFEGEQRGNFTEMGEQVARILNDMGMDEHKLLVNDERIYFQARNGDKYLYEIIDRSPRRSEEGDRT
jgi:hypothetical protein